MVVDVIIERSKFSEERVYQAIVNTTFDFVEMHLKNTSVGLKDELNNMF